MAKRLSRSRRANRGGGSSAPRPNAPSVVSAEPENLSEQYSYVLRDLSRVGIIAFILIGGLVALSFFLK